jgi:hypothetical protein
MPDMQANLLLFKEDFISLKRDIHVLGDVGDRSLVLQIAPEREERDQPVQRPAFQIVEAEGLRDASCDRALTRGRGAVDRDDRYWF